MRSERDAELMREVLRLAVREGKLVKGNPRVGALLVCENGSRKVGNRERISFIRGAHRRFGGPHAEVEVLRRAGARARGATLVVNLEPCSHWGKTPPCADAVIAAGVRRVVVAMEDPNPWVRGRGIRRLRAAGVEVVTGVEETRARAVNRSFLRRLATRTDQPLHTIVKTVMTVDGKINRAEARTSTVLSPARDLRNRDAERAEVDAIMVGGNTVLLDDPRLTIRSSRLHRERTSRGQSSDPVKIAVITDAGKISISSRFLTTGKCEKIIFTTSKTSAAARRRLDALAHVFVLGRTRVDMRKAYRILQAFGIQRVMVEGGGTLNAELFRLGLVNEFWLKIAPRIFGGADAPTVVDGKGVDATLELQDVKRVTKNFIVVKYKVI